MSQLLYPPVQPISSPPLLPGRCTATQPAWYAAPSGGPMRGPHLAGEHFPPTVELSGKI